MKLKSFLAVLSIFTLTIFSSGCGNEVQDQPVNNLQVGTDIDFPPFVFNSPDSKEYQGFDMDIIRAIGRELGQPVQIGSINFDGLIPSLKAGNIDVIIAAMTITDERKNSVAFSDPYYESGLTIMIRSDDTSINSFSDLSGKKIGVKLASTSENIAETIPNVTILEYDLASESFNALKNRTVDAVISDRPVNDYAVANNQITGVKILPDMLTHENYGIAVRKDDVELLQKINDVLKKLHDTGEYDQIYAKWFGKR